MSLDVQSCVQLPIDDLEGCKREAVHLVNECRPEWKAKTLKYKFHTEGITNKIFSVWPEDESDRDRIVFRVYGVGTDSIIDRELELDTWRMLSARNCAACLYGTFGNGILCGYLPGQPLTVTKITRKHIQLLIAAKVAELHQIPISASAQSSEANPDYDGSVQSGIYDKIRLFISKLPQKFDDAEKQRKFESEFPSVTELEAELLLIASEAKELASPVVFCHNDLLINNIIHDLQNDSVSFIDYEYAMPNYQAFDIANHFCEYAGIENMDFSLYPNREQQWPWLEAYLHNMNTTTTEEQIERLYVQVNRFAHVSHFFWCIWAIVQAKNSTIDFDFLQYGIDRWNEHLNLKKKFAHLKF